VYTVSNPLGAAENALIGAVLNAGSGGRASKNRHGSSQRAVPASTAVAGRAGSSSAPTAPPAATSRALAGAASLAEIAQLMSVERERFESAVPVVLQPPAPVDLVALRRQLWSRRKREVPVWRSSARRRLADDVTREASIEASVATRAASDVHGASQARADAWWRALQAGEPDTVTAALNAAFSDNAAPVTVVQCDGVSAALLLHLPGAAVVPEVGPHVTPGGRLSAKKWTKTEFQELYARLLAAHLLATAREAWAVAPSLDALRVIGVAAADSDQVLFDVDLARGSGDWSDDTLGRQLLTVLPYGLRRVGRIREVQPWPAEAGRGDVLDLVHCPALVVQRAAGPLPAGEPSEDPSRAKDAAPAAIEAPQRKESRERSNFGASLWESAWRAVLPGEIVLTTEYVTERTWGRVLAVTDRRVIVASLRRTETLPPVTGASIGPGKLLVTTDQGERRFGWLRQRDSERLARLINAAVRDARGQQPGYGTPAPAPEVSRPLRFNAPPTWPPPPLGWSPGPGWQPDPTWPPPPPGWQLWVPDAQVVPAVDRPRPRPGPGPRPRPGR
jgi:hypothetical protein